MATPTYKGRGQPAADNGFLSGLGSWFGGETPSYRGAGQPSGSTVGSATPAYRPAPAASSPSSTAPGTAAAVVSPCPDPFGPGAVAIVVPRDLIDPQQ
jgi:hypothetical protein